jgi:hypothetical protein
MDLAAVADTRNHDHDYGICATCADFTMNDIDRGEPPHLQPGVSVSLANVQENAPKCISGGCDILLRAIATLVPLALATPSQISLIRVNSWSCRFGIWHWNTGYLSFVELFTERQASSYAESRASQLANRRHPRWPAIGYSLCSHDLSSEKSISFIGRELYACTAFHGLCSASTGKEGVLPKRLLDLGQRGASSTSHDEAPIKLVETAQEDGIESYACLSHRWAAAEQTIITEKATLKERRSKIAFEKLGRVYQDAVVILRKMNIRYVWIDSLCIIQDDPEDWRLESEAMATTYSEALFTLARQCNENSMVSVRALPRKSFQVFSGDAPVYARMVPRHPWEHQIGDEDMSWKPKQFPLSGRGWIYQERLLSRRMVHVSDFEISWECNERETCQCTARRPDDSWRFRSKADFATAAYTHACEENDPEDGIRHLWRSMVGQYSELQLSEISDRVPAIRGCAIKIGKALGDDYIFGAWKRGLLEDMLWHVISHCQRRTRPAPLSHVPTWSWMAVQSAVSFISDPTHLIVAKYARFELLHQSSFEDTARDTGKLRIISQTLPAQLLLKQPQSTDDPGYDIMVDSRYMVNADPGLVKWPRYQFRPDIALQARNRQGRTEQLDIRILRMARFACNDRYHEAHRWHLDRSLIVWNYGREVPDHDADLERSAKSGSYQRIGDLTTALPESNISVQNLHAWLNESRIGSQDLGEIVTAVLDWTQAEQTCILLE